MRGAIRGVIYRLRYAARERKTGAIRGAAALLLLRHAACYTYATTHHALIKARMLR